jgi:hypothetical protein
VNDGRRSDSYYVEIEKRLLALAPVARSVLPADTMKWYLEFVQVGEYGLAVEVAVEVLSDDSKAGRDLAKELMVAAQDMGLDKATAELRVIAGL